MPMNHRLSHVLLASGLAVACLAAGRGAHAQDIEITPAPAQSATAAPGVRLQGFPADAEIAVRFIRTPPDGLPPAYSASATFRAGRDGAVDVLLANIQADVLMRFARELVAAVAPRNSGVVSMTFRSMYCGGRIPIGLPS